MNEIPIIYLFIYKCKCIRNHNMISCTLLNNAANADANMSVVVLELRGFYFIFFEAKRFDGCF